MDEWFWNREQEKDQNKTTLVEKYLSNVFLDFLHSKQPQDEPQLERPEPSPQRNLPVLKSSGHSWEQQGSGRVQTAFDSSILL